MVRKPLILKLFSAFYMQRWNDRLRPTEFIEMDKQAHKMIIAYFLGKFEEKKQGFDWVKVIEGGIFELLQRIVLTDIKPPVFYKIKADTAKYQKLNDFVFNELKPYIGPLGGDFCGRFREYFASTDDTVNKRLLSAAHMYASSWEYQLILRVNPDSYDKDIIKNDFIHKMEQYNDLEGIKELALHNSYKNFIDLCGQLRFQSRWAQLHRIPRTSVLGHSVFVAILAYLFSLKAGACAARKYNNYFSGLFHDLPEVLTRDIISPVKRSIEGLSDLIKEYEKEQLEMVIYPLIPPSIQAEISKFSENEFENFIIKDNRLLNVSTAEIQEKYNQDQYNPRDGELVKACDELSAFIEADVAIKNGCMSGEFEKARWYIKDKYEDRVISGVPFGEIYADFKETI